MAKPNILWICSDQQRYDTIRALGNSHINTPNLDKLVRAGTAFTMAFAQSPLCSPSRASFLTGRYPRTVGVRQNGQDHFPDHEKVITKMLAEHGYTCGLVGKLHLAAACGRVEKRTDDGYSKFYWSHHPFPNHEWRGHHNYEDWLADKGVYWDTEKSDVGAAIIDNYVRLKHAGAGIPEDYHQSRWVRERAVDFIRETEEPWCLSLNFFDPHHPFDPPETYLERYDPAQMPLPRCKDAELHEKPFPQRLDSETGAYAGEQPALALPNMTDRERQEVTAAYYAMIEFMDNEIGAILDALDEAGKRENTIVIFLSDHGEMLGDHGIYLKGPHCYDPAVRVPLIISYPTAFQSDVRFDGLVELVDIVPTLLDTLEMEMPSSVQGKSLLDILKGTNRTGEHRDGVYCEYYNGHYLYEGKRVYNTMYREKDYKIVVYHGIEEGELYDLRKDPDEFDNLWHEQHYQQIKCELLKKCFDRSVFTMDPLPERVGLW
jgi:arylsulfatase A-like enzyme